jgi:signal transduction histidine kinase
MASDASSERILVVAPFGRDAEAAVSILERHRLAAVAFPDLRALCEGARAGAGALIIAEEALTRPQVSLLAAFLDEQPAWSDLPVIALAPSESGRSVARPSLLAGFNVTILERPVSMQTLVAAVHVALRARRRQYEVRSLLEERATLLDREREARARAESASRAKDDFLAILGHELRNPLSPIVTALQLVRLRGAPGIERELTILDRQVMHLSRLVDDLLDVSRIAQGKIDLKREAVPLREVVARAIEMASPLLEQRRHHLGVDVPEDLRLRADATRLAQVIANLVTNAAKYTPPEGRITVTAAREGGRVALRVRDDGIGIDPEMLPRVFDLFVQERQAIDRAQGGLGLGLSIVRSLVALHAGTVEARSEGPGKGSEFVVSLPVLEESAAAEERGRSSPVPALSSAQAPRVLVVDDNEDAAETLALLLSADGYATRVAHDGPRALALVGDFVPDVAVLDIGLPVMDGYELARRLRAESGVGRVRLIALTGYGQADDVRRAKEAGFDEHLVKPVDPTKREATVARLLGAAG